MDCEKFDPLLVEELYQELDDVTSAALRRHVVGCDRCTSVLDSLRSTRERTRLAAVVASPDLEARIFSRLKEEKRPVAVPSRADRVFSWAGSWAMRPQTAMAAVFLLMIGTSAFAIRARQSSDRRAAVSVLEQGSPAGPAESAGDHESLDSNAAAAAHGAGTPPVPAATGPAMSGAVASADTKTGESRPELPRQNPGSGVMDGLTGNRGGVTEQAIGSVLGGITADDSEHRAARGRAEESDPSAKSPKKSSVGQAEPRDVLNAAAPAGAPKDENPSNEGRFSETPQDSFSAGMTAYRARNFAEAAQKFDGATRSGDPNAALWAAKSVKDGAGGCSVALPRFDLISRTSSDSWIRSEAQLESARCEISRGQTVSARERLTSLASVPSHAAAAQQTLSELTHQVASRSEAERAKQGAASPKPTRPAARPAAASPRVESAK